MEPVTVKLSFTNLTSALNESKTYSIYSVGDTGLTICFGNGIEDEVYRQVQIALSKLKSNPPSGWLDIIPAYTSITIIYKLTNYSTYKVSVFEVVKREVEERLIESDDFEIATTRLLNIPICFDSKFALDKIRLEQFANTSFEHLIDIFLSQTYNVYLLGFLPGFPYMASVDKQIAAPRLASPRKLVEAGSVGIAGEQTGIYPLNSPGGWNIIGRTPLRIIDIESSTPTFFQPGDRVRFFLITLEDFFTFDQSQFNPVGDGY